MAADPLIRGIVTVTAKDINGGNIAKVFNNVSSLNYDYVKGMGRVVDLVQGEYYFPLTPLTSVTYTIVANPAGSHTVVMS